MRHHRLRAPCRAEGRPALGCIDDVFGNVRGVNGCHINGAVPALGWLPYGAGVAAGALVGALVGCASLPIGLVGGSTARAWMGKALLQGAILGGYAGAVPRWALCQLSAAVGLVAKVSVLAATTAFLLLRDMIVTDLHLWGILRSARSKQMASNLLARLSCCRCSLV